jgi:hypothetical protein
MTTYTTYANGRTIAAASGGEFRGSPDRTVIYGEFDSALQNLASTNIAEVVNIPAGTVVEGVVLTILTPETTGSSTISVGDGGGTTGWVSAVDSTAAAGTKYLGAGSYAVAVGIGKLYATADTLDILADSGKVATTLKVRVTAFCSTT